jgi:hypothetical protein
VQAREVRLGASPLRGHVEHAPDRPDRVDVAGFLALVSWREHELGGPRVTQPVAVADEDVEGPAPARPPASPRGSRGCRCCSARREGEGAASHAPRRTCGPARDPISRPRRGLAAGRGGERRRRANPGSMCRTGTGSRRAAAAPSHPPRAPIPPAGDPRCPASSSVSIPTGHAAFSAASMPVFQHPPGEVPLGQDRLEGRSISVAATRGRVGMALVLPAALLEARGAKTGAVRRNAVIYFHTGKNGRRVCRSGGGGIRTPGPG